MPIKQLSKISDRVSCESSICKTSCSREHVGGSILRIEVQPGWLRARRAARSSPRDVHELCGPHDAESGSAKASPRAACPSRAAPSRVSAAPVSLATKAICVPNAISGREHGFLPRSPQHCTRLGHALRAAITGILAGRARRSTVVKVLSVNCLPQRGPLANSLRHTAAQGWFSWLG